MIDDEDFERISAFKWYITRRGTIQRNGGPTGKVSVAAEIMGNITQMYDHKNRNPKDNRKKNLRPCTRGQNESNKAKMEGTTSKYKGVSWSKEKQKWFACIRHEGRTLYLGRYNSENEAAEAHNKKALEIFGEFAFVNKINYETST